jgi:hypothetical protein
VTVIVPGEMLVPVLRLPMVIEAVPELAECEPSPEYDAVTVMEPIEAEDEGVYVTVQVLELEVEAERVQPVPTKVPPLPPSLQITVPVGADGVPVPVSVTVAAYVTGDRLPMTSEVVPGATAVDVVLRTVPVIRCTVKLVPSVEREDVCAITLSLASTMSMDWTAEPNDPIGATVPPMLA